MTTKETEHVDLLERMRACAVVRDAEGAHAEADRILCELLRRLGYEEIVEIFEGMTKWYA